MLINGDSKKELKKLSDNSVDSIVTDPPYGISFMGREWDYDVPDVEIWKQCYRVLKPGGFLLSFTGTKTYHRIAMDIMNSGFNYKNQFLWMYGSGFPKNYNIGKAYDKKIGNEREVVGYNQSKNFDDIQYKSQGSMMRTLTKSSVIKLNGTKVTSPYEGLGTALKPAFEPIFCGVKGTTKIKISGKDKYKYLPKAQRSERDEGLTIPNRHPTVKPVDLIYHFINLVTPKGGTVLDPFLGSGTTAVACIKNGFDYIGIERDKEYFETITKPKIDYFELKKSMIKRWQKNQKGFYLLPPKEHYYLKQLGREVKLNNWKRYILLLDEDNIVGLNQEEYDQYKPRKILF